MSNEATYPIGTPGRPWGAAEVATWLSQQTARRSYAVDVLSVIDSLRARFDVSEYGRLDYPPDNYPLFAIKSRDWRDELPVVLVTGGVHGYETSGVHGALQFVDQQMSRYAGKANIVVRPVSARGPTSASTAGMPMRWIRIARFVRIARRRNLPR